MASSQPKYVVRTAPDGAHYVVDIAANVEVYGTFHERHAREMCDRMNDAVFGAD